MTYKTPKDIQCCSSHPGIPTAASRSEIPISALTISIPINASDIQIQLQAMERSPLKRLISPNKQLKPSTYRKSRHILVLLGVQDQDQDQELDRLHCAHTCRTCAFLDKARNVPPSLRLKHIRPSHPKDPLTRSSAIQPVEQYIAKL